MFGRADSRFYGVRFTGPLPAGFRELWSYENPDTYRGYPFRRWMKPGSGTGDAFYDTSGEIGEIVEVPLRIEHQSHLRDVWRLGYPEAWNWYLKDSVETMIRYNGIVFIKADW